MLFANARTMDSIFDDNETPEVASDENKEAFEPSLTPDSAASENISASDSSRRFALFISFLVFS